MGNKGKKKKDSEKELAKKARKAQKAEKIEKRREARERGGEDVPIDDDEEEDIDKVLAEAARREASRREIVIEGIEGEERRREIFGRIHCSLTTVGRDEMWLFGGEKRHGDTCRVYGDLFRWRLDKDDWTQVSSPNGPAPRCSHQACELASHKLYFFGGEYATLTQFRHFNDLWVFDCKKMSWEQRGQSTKGPSPRSGHRAKAWRGQFLLFGGFFKRQDAESIWFDDLWLYTPSRDEWSQIQTTTIPGAVKPPGRSACVLGIISASDTLCLWGGYSEIKCDSALKARGKHHTDAWQLDLSPFLINNTTKNPQAISSSSSSLRWQRLPLKGEAPSPRSGMRAAGTKPDLLYVFGGVHDDDENEKSNIKSIFFNQVYVLDFANRRWYRIPFNDPAPMPRLGAAVALRASLLYVAGGALETKGDRERTFDDLWTLDVHARLWKCLLALLDQEAITLQANDDSDDLTSDEDQNAEEEEDDDEEEDEEDTIAASFHEDQKDPPQQHSEEKDEAKDEDKLVTPRDGESLRDFFDRTRDHWLAQPDLPQDASAKDLKRAAFQLASESFQSVNMTHISSL